MQSDRGVDISRGGGKEPELARGCCHAGLIAEPLSDLERLAVALLGGDVIPAQLGEDAELMVAAGGPAWSPSRSKIWSAWL